MILAEPRAQDVDIVVITHARAMTGEDGPRQQVRFARKKKVAFDIAIEKDTFFEDKHTIGRNLSNSPVIEMPSAFDPSVQVVPS